MKGLQIVPREDVIMEADIVGILWMEGDPKSAADMAKARKDSNSRRKGLRASPMKGSRHVREKCDTQPRRDSRDMSRNREEAVEKKSTQSCGSDRKGGPHQHSKGKSNEGRTRGRQP